MWCISSSRAGTGEIVSYLLLFGCCIYGHVKFHPAFPTLAYILFRSITPYFNYSSLVVRFSSPVFRLCRRSHWRCRLDRWCNFRDLTTEFNDCDFMIVIKLASTKTIIFEFDMNHGYALSWLSRSDLIRPSPFPRLQIYFSKEFDRYLHLTPRKFSFCSRFSNYTLHELFRMLFTKPN